MYLKHFIGDLECDKKSYYRELNLSVFQGKEKHYKTLLKFMNESLIKLNVKRLKRDPYYKNLKLYIKQLYMSDDYVHENASAEVHNTVNVLFERLYSYLSRLDVTRYSKGRFYNVTGSLDDVGLITYKYDLLVEHSNGVIEAIIIESSKPKYKYRGQKFNTKVESSIELNSLLLNLINEYPDNEVKASIYYLRNREDKKNIYPDFDHKKGCNIVSLTKMGVEKKLKKSELTIEEYIKERVSDYLSEEHAKDCTMCRNKNICKFEEISSIEDKKNVRLGEVNDEVTSSSGSIILNEQQSNILSNLKGVSQVVAVPGAGKTRIIVEGIKRLLKEKVDPKNILVLTFTNKATQELKLRLGGNTDVYITNYNTFGYRLVRKHYDELGFEYPPRLVTQYESFEIIREILELYQIPFKYEYLYDRNYGVMWEIYKSISYAVSNGMMRNITMLELEKHEYRDRFKLKDDFLDFIPLIASRYNNALRERNLISYDQQIDLVNELFSKNENLVDALTSSYRYVFLDEYQDTNSQQHKMITTFAKQNVLMVGDEDQSIFSFRGSTPMNFLSFMKDGHNKHYLSLNYRSGSEIIRMANKLISKNKIRNDKLIYPANGSKGVYNEHKIEKYEDVVEIVDSLLDKNIKPEDIAIISRKNKHITAFKELLTKEGYDSQTNYNRLLEEPDFIKLHALLKVLALDSERNDEYVVMKHIYKAEHIPEGSIINEHIKLNTEVVNQVLEDITMFNMMENPKEQLSYIFELIGCYKGPLHEYIEDLYGNLHLLNLKELNTVLNGMVTIDEDVTIPTKGDGINLITAHSSKGLEFKAVIVYSVEDFKGKGTEEEEERRLLYVAMTRAEMELHMTTIKSNKDQVMMLQEVI